MPGTPPIPTDPAALGTEGDASFQLLLRARLDRESELIGRRTGWVVASQAFLFSAYAVALNGRPDPSTPGIVAKSRLLITVIPWVSVITLSLLYLTIAGGVAAGIRLRRHIVRDADPRVRILEVGPIPLLSGGAGLLVPVVFLVTWLILIFHR